MTSKKYLLIVCTLLLTSAVFAQVQVGGYSIWDSSVISRKNMPQHNEFMNNMYNYPAKPRNMVEVGVSGGSMSIAGDVTSQFPTFGFAVHARKAIGYSFSLRLQYVNGVAKGLNWQASEYYFGSNNPWIKAGYSSSDGDIVYHNYKSKIQDLSIQGIYTINNLRFHRHQTKFQLYVGAGIGATAYNTMVDAKDANGADYSSLFNSIYSGANDPNSNYLVSYKNRKDILKALKDGMDGDYESAAQTKGGKGSQLGDNNLRFSTTVLAGVAFRLNRRINIALEDRLTMVKDDLLDGQQWQDSPAQVLTSNWDSYNFLSLGLNINLGK
jgi:hypothetical protein